MKFLIPWLSEFKSNPIESMFDRYKDQSLMASRLYYACTGNVKMTCVYPDPKDPEEHLMYDYFLNKRPDGTTHFFQDPPHQDNIVFICECSDIDSRVHKDKKSRIQFNPFTCNYLKRFDGKDFHRSNIVQKFNSKELTIPLGSFNKFCRKRYHKKKMIILDEPHCWSLMRMEKSQNFLNQDAFSYLKAIEICKILEGRGFKIATFCTRSDSKLFSRLVSKDWILIDRGSYSWVPYLEMLEFYSQGTLFFSHYQETHGFSIYDNLQLGNGVVIFEENFNPFTINQFQNGVRLGLRMSNKTCADLIEEYHNTYSERTFEQIREDSTKNFSCDTFIARLKKALSSVLMI